ncbi:MAG: Holliday junction resolvase RuvX [Candidatus Dojkabacteria bacterium]
MINYPILAIDYGEKHFGLAYSDFNGKIASPLDVISITKNRDIENIISEILEVCEEYKIRTILVGMPQKFKESHKKTEKKILSFISKIKEQTKIPILTQDESFSTISAQNVLTSSGQSVKKSRKKIDSIAATVFLQEFLNSKN